MEKLASQRNPSLFKILKQTMKKRKKKELIFISSSTLRDNSTRHQR
jgi:hypothetical protein